MSQLFEWSLPSWIPEEPWQHFVKMRKQKKAKNPWTELARDRAITRLDEMRRRGIDIAEVLLTCAEYGWVGVEWGEAELVKRARRNQAATHTAHESAHFRALRIMQETKNDHHADRQPVFVAGQ